MKTYIAYDLSRNRFKTGRSKTRDKKRAELCHGRYFDEDKNRVVRCYRGKRSRYLKTECNRRLRHSHRDFSSQQPGRYRRCTEFWYILD